MQSHETPATVNNNQATITDRLGVIALILSCVAIGMIAMMPFILQAKIDALKSTVDQAVDSATRSENHVRNRDTDIKVIEHDIEELKHARR